jgi:GTPase SAR1 family protein
MKRQADENGKEKEEVTSGKEDVISGLEEIPLDESGDEKGESEEQAREAASSSSSKKSSPSFFSSLLGNAKVEVQPKFQDIKLMVVGDAMDWHKKKLLDRYIEQCPPDSIGQGSYGYNVRLNIVPDKPVVMHLWSTEGMEDKDSIRRLSYQHTGVFILLYSVTNKESYENIGRWVEEIKSLCPNAQYILVGCDNDNSAHSVTYEEGAQQAKEIGAAAFLNAL